MVAVHVNHGLHPDSRKWARHCKNVSAALDIEFRCLEVTVTSIKQSGVEAAARQARYQTLQTILSQDDVLLTAQHQQDQAETVLLQLLRGAGVKGLSAMAKCWRLGNIQLIRPFLTIPKVAIIAYAKQHKLQWVDDPSNDDTQRDRNYIRHLLLPVIEKRWPGASKTISRSAEHCAETSELLVDLAISDLANMGIDKPADTLTISSLLSLSSPRRRNVLRYWISLKRLPLPSASSLQKIIDEVCLARQDSRSLLCWDGVQVRRYRDELYIMKPLVKHDVRQVIHCNSLDDIAMGDQYILSWDKRQGEGIKEKWILSGLTIRFRQGGERCQPHGKLKHVSLKHLFQQWAVPPWQRDSIPLLYHGDKLIAVAGYMIAQGYAASSSEYGWSVTVRQLA